jgi:carbohydrate-binding DOMON domain-containing protein
VSIEDRLTFGEGPLGGTPPEMEPEEPEDGGKPNRAFIFIAIAMGGLIVLGVLALVGALAFWLPRQKEARIASVTQTVVAMTQVAAAWTPTSMPSPTVVLSTPTVTPLPTWTVEPTATATRVVTEDKLTTQPTSTPTRSAAADWTTGGTTPTAGLGGFGMAAIAVGLAGLVAAVRKLRSQ